MNAVPGGSIELEREDDVIGMADLTDKAALRAQVALEHMVGGELQQRHQVGGILALCYLGKRKT